MTKPSGQFQMAQYTGSLRLGFVGRGRGQLLLYSGDDRDDGAVLARCAVGEGTVTCPFRLGSGVVSGVVLGYEPGDSPSGAVVLDWWSITGQGSA